MKLILMCFIYPLFLFKAQAHEENIGAAIGPDKAVRDTRSERQEFKLSEATVNIFGIQLIQLKSDNSGTFIVPNNALVSYQENFGIYVEKDGWFRLIKVKKMIMLNEQTRISSPLLKPNMKVVSRGTEFVRITHVHLTSTINDEGEE